MAGPQYPYYGAPQAGGSPAASTQQYTPPPGQQPNPQHPQQQQQQQQQQHPQYPQYQAPQQQYQPPGQPTPPAQQTPQPPQYGQSPQLHQQPYPSYGQGNQAQPPGQPYQYGQTQSPQQQPQQQQQQYRPTYGQPPQSQGPPQYGQSPAPSTGGQQPAYQQGGSQQTPPQYGQYGATPGATPPAAAPRPGGGGFMSQVNHAVSSSKPLLQGLAGKINKKLDEFQKPHGQAGQAPPAPHYGAPPAAAGPGSGGAQGAGTAPGAGVAAGAGAAVGAGAAAGAGPSNLVGPMYGLNISQPPPPQAQAAPVYGMPPAQPTPTPSVTSVAASSPASSVPPAYQPGKKWTFVDPVTEQPTPEFIVIAELIFESLQKATPPKAYYLTAKQMVEGWKADGVDADSVALFEYGSYLALPRIWSLQGIPHFFVPAEPAMAPTIKMLAALETPPTGPRHIDPIQYPVAPAAGSTPPAYLPALSFEGYVKSVFLDMFHEPESLPKIVNNRCSDTYNRTRHPDLGLYDPSCPPALQKKVHESLVAALELVVAEIAQDKAKKDAVAAAAAAPAAGASAGAGGGMTPLEAQLKMQQLQNMSNINNMMNQTMIQGGQSFNAAAGNGVWVQRY